MVVDSVVPQDFSFAARDVILNMTVLEGLGLGMYSAVFWFTLYVLVTAKRPRGIPQRLSTFYIIIPLYILAIIHFCARWLATRGAFVVHGDSADDILNGFLHQPQWCTIISVISFSLMTLIADFFTVWRCWVIWDRNWKVVAVPFMLVLNGTAFCVMGDIYQIEPQTGLDTPRFNTFAKYATIFFSCSLASMVITTALMVYRMTALGRMTGLDWKSPYRKATEMLLESAAIYCVALLVFLPFLVRDDFSSGYPEAVLCAVTGISPTVIAGRVALGMSRDYSTVHHSVEISTLQFRPNATSTPEGSIRGENTNDLNTHGSKTKQENSSLSV